MRPIYGETLYPRLQLGWADLRSVVDDRWHYIHGPRPELYDLVADPGEKNDLVKPERATAANLARALLRFPQGNEKPAPEDEETLKRLAALGYIGSLRDRAGGTDLPNPVDNIANLRRMEEGWHLAGLGQTERAIEHLTVMVAENPGMSEAWIKLARAARRTRGGTTRRPRRTGRCSTARRCLSPTSRSRSASSSCAGSASTRPRSSRARRSRASRRRRTSSFPGWRSRRETSPPPSARRARPPGGATRSPRRSSPSPR